MWASTCCSAPIGRWLDSLCRKYSSILARRLPNCPRFGRSWVLINPVTNSPLLQHPNGVCSPQPFASQGNTALLHCVGWHPHICGHLFRSCTKHSCPRFSTNSSSAWNRDSTDPQSLKKGFTALHTSPAWKWRCPVSPFLQFFSLLTFTHHSF